MKFGLATLFRPRTRGWGAASAAIEEYVDEREAADRQCASACMRKERSDERQVQKRRLLSGLRAGRDRPRLQPLHQGAWQGARPRPRRAQELELLRRHGGQERRSEAADLSVGAQSLDRRKDGLRHRHGAVQRLLSQSEKGRIRPRQRPRLARGRPTGCRARPGTRPTRPARSRPSTRSTGSSKRSAKKA